MMAPARTGARAISLTGPVPAMASPIAAWCLSRSPRKSSQPGVATPSIVV